MVVEKGWVNRGGSGEEEGWVDGVKILYIKLKNSWNIVMKLMNSIKNKLKLQINWNFQLVPVEDTYQPFSFFLLIVLRFSSSSFFLFFFFFFLISFFLKYYWLSPFFIVSKSGVQWNSKSGLWRRWAWPSQLDHSQPDLC